MQKDTEARKGRGLPRNHVTPRKTMSSEFGCVWFGTLALPLTNCIALAKLLTLPESYLFFFFFLSFAMCIYWITELLRALTGIMLIKFRDIVNKENVNPCKYPFLISKKAMSTIDSPAEEIAGQAHRYLSPSTW